MQKVFEVVVVGDDPKELVDFVMNKAFKDKPQSVNVLVQEVDKKRRYTKEDDEVFCMNLYIRIAKDSSKEFIAGFNTMFAYWDKIKEDGNWWKFSPRGTFLPCIESHLTSLQAFLFRMDGLGYDGTLEVRLDPYVPSFSSHPELKKEDLYQRMLDKHVTLLKWTNLKKWVNHD